MLQTLGRGMSVIASLSAINSAPSFSPASINGYYADFNAADTSSYTVQNETELIGLADVSGSGRNLLYGTNPMRVYERTIEGVPAISNDGTGSLSVSDIGLNPSTDDFTIFTVVMVDDINNNDCPWAWGSLRALIQGNEQLSYFDGSYYGSGGNPINACEVGGLHVLAHASGGTTDTFYNGTLGNTQSGVTLNGSTTFVIGSLGLNNTSNAIYGAIGRVIIYDRKLNDGERQQVEDYLYNQWRVGAQLSQNIELSAAGQSNIERQFTQSAGSGATNTETALGTYFSGTIDFVDGATSGSALLKENVAGGFDDDWWYDQATGDFGPSYDVWATSVSGRTIRAILWDQGEQDGSVWNVSTGFTQQNYQDSLETLFTQMRLVVGNVPIIICPLGRNTYGSDFDGWQMVREVQYNMPNVMDKIFIMGGKTQHALADNVHIDQTGRETLGTAQGDFIGRLFGRGQGSAAVIPPRIESVSRSGTSVTVNLEHREGSDFTPTTGIEGFVFYEGGYPKDGTGTEINITAAVRTDADTITLTLASAPTDSTEVLVYQLSGMNGSTSSAGAVTNTNLLEDNASPTIPFSASVWRDTGSGFSRIAGG